MSVPENPASGRGSFKLWLDAAQKALLAGGVDAVRIQPLAQSLQISRTSFYWFFKDRDELLFALLNKWRESNSGSIVKKAGDFAETVVEAMLNVMDCWLDPRLFDDRFEFAVRSWALQSDYVLTEVRQADDERLEALSLMFQRFDVPRLVADVRARATYLAQIGYISMQTKEDISMRMRRIPAYVEIFTGCKPEPRELARFHARHGYAP